MYIKLWDAQIKYIYINNIGNIRVAIKRIIYAQRNENSANYRSDQHRSFNWLVNRRSQNLNNKLLNFLRINTLLVHDADVWIITAPSCRLTHRGSEGIANFYPRVHLSSEFYFTPTKTSVKKRANATINKKKKYKTTWKLAISNIFGRQLLKFTIWSICDKKKKYRKRNFQIFQYLFSAEFY